MAFWDNFKKALGGDKSAAQKVVDTLSPFTIGKRNLEANTKRVLGGVKAVADVAQPVLEPLGKAAGFLGKGVTAPFQALGTQIGGGPGATAVQAGAKIGTTRVAQQIARESGTDLNSLLKD